MGRDQRRRVDLGHYVEMGLRSHLFINEFDSSAGAFNSLSLSHRDPYAFHVVDTLPDQFSSMSLRPPKPITFPPSPTSLQRLRQKSLASANDISDYGPKVDQRIVYGERPPQLSLSTTDPLYELYLSRLRKNEAAQQDRATILQSQEERLRKGGLVHRDGNVLKESVGTGVFHPRLRPAYKTLSYPKKRRDHRNRNQSEKELMTKERRVMSAKQQDECHYHLPSDMDFSKDWTF